MENERIVLLKLNDKRDVFTTVPKEMQYETKKRIGSQFAPGGSRDVIRGLNPALEKIFLPSTLGVNANAAEFTEKAKVYWADFSIVPTVEGIRLNIATEKKTVKNENGDAEEIDVPRVPEDYMRYQFAIQSDKVAYRPEQLVNLGAYDFYIEDLEEVKQKQYAENKDRDEADYEYSKIRRKFDDVDSRSQIMWVLQIMKDRNQSLPNEGNEQEVLALLRKHKDNTPKKFLEVMRDPELESKALLAEALALGVVTKEGNDYFNQDESMGTEKAAVVYLKKPENSAKVIALKSRLAERKANVK